LHEFPETKSDELSIPELRGVRNYECSETKSSVISSETRNDKIQKHQRAAASSRAALKMRPLIIAVACFDHFSCPLEIELVHHEIVIDDSPVLQ
jgi:hypothetical protein